jgi:hypothetical protein
MEIVMRYCAHGPAKISLRAHPEWGTVPMAHCRKWPGWHRLAGGEV